jgi:uncharacterized protein YkwD
MRATTISRTPARCVALTVAVLAITPAPAAAAPASPPAALNACAAATQLDAMVCLVNQTRAAHGLPAVRPSSILRRSAALRASAIVRCRQFSHTPCGQSFGSVFRAVGYTRGRAAVGENLAWGSGSLGSAEHALSRWLTSPGHRRVLLSRGWRELGVSAVGVTGLFAPGANTVWVAQFGRRR